MKNNMMKTVRIDKMEHITCDGTKLAFRLHTADQWHKDMHMSVADAGKFVALILSTFARQVPAIPAIAPAMLQAVPIPAKSIGSGIGPDGAQLVAVNLGLMQLVFSLPNQGSPSSDQTPTNPD